MISRCFIGCRPTVPKGDRGRICFKDLLYMLWGQFNRMPPLSLFLFVQKNVTFCFPASASSLELIKGLSRKSRCSLIISQLDGFSMSRSLLLEVQYAVMIQTYCIPTWVNMISDALYISIFSGVFTSEETTRLLYDYYKLFYLSKLQLKNISN